MLVEKAMILMVDSNCEIAIVSISGAKYLAKYIGEETGKELLVYYWRAVSELNLSGASLEYFIKKHNMQAYQTDKNVVDYVIKIDEYII